MFSMLLNIFNDEEKYENCKEETMKMKWNKNLIYVKEHSKSIESLVAMFLFIIFNKQ